MGPRAIIKSHLGIAPRATTIGPGGRVTKTHGEGPADGSATHLPSPRRTENCEVSHLKLKYCEVSDLKVRELKKESSHLKVVQLRSLTSDITNSKVSRLKLENCKVSHLKLTYCEVSHLKVRELKSLTSESSATAKSHI